MHLSFGMKGSITLFVATPPLLYNTNIWRLCFCLFSLYNKTLFCLFYSSVANCDASIESSMSSDSICIHFHCCHLHANQKAKKKKKSTFYTSLPVLFLFLLRMVFYSSIYPLHWLSSQLFSFFISHFFSFRFFFCLTFHIFFDFFFSSSHCILLF